MSMTLENWLNNDWLRIHKTSKNEINNLFMIVGRDLEDTKQKIIYSITEQSRHYRLS